MFFNSTFSIVIFRDDGLPILPISVYKSTLEVTYDGAAVPEPATCLLLGAGLRRRRAA